MKFQVINKIWVLLFVKIILINIIGCSIFKNKTENIKSNTNNNILKREFTKINVGNSIDSNNVLSLFIGKNQHNHEGLFLGTMSGLYFYSFSNKSISQIVDVENKLKHLKVYSIYQEDGGRLWIGTDNGVLSYNFSAVRFFDIGKVNAIIQSNEGYVWVGTQNGLALYDGSKNFNKFTKKSNDLPHDDILCFAKNTVENSIIAGTRQGIIVIKGLSNFTFKTGTSFKPTPTGDLILEEGNTEMQGNSIYAIAFNSQNVMYIGTNLGLNRCKNFMNWTHFSADTEIPAKLEGGIGYKKVSGNSPLISNWIKSIYIDNEDGIWIATAKGISYFNGDNKWENYTTNEGLAANNVNAILGSGRTIYIATSNGLNIFDFPKKESNN